MGDEVVGDELGEVVGELVVGEVVGELVVGEVVGVLVGDELGTSPEVKEVKKNMETTNERSVFPLFSILSPQIDNVSRSTSSPPFPHSFQCATPFFQRGTNKLQLD